MANDDTFITSYTNNYIEPRKYMEINRLKLLWGVIITDKQLVEFSHVWSLNPFCWNFNSHFKLEFLALFKVVVHHKLLDKFWV